jgi:cobalt-zinc-cadmium efflux system protein
VSGPHNHQPGNGHPRASAAAGSQKRLLMVMGLSGLYLAIEVVGGLMAGSLALLADAGHMLTDVLGLGMALFAIRFAQRPATPTKTYGFYRTEILAALVNSLILFGVAFSILYEAWDRFKNPPEINALLMLGVAVGGFFVTLTGVKLLQAGAKENLNVKGAFLEVFSDLLASIGTILAALVILATGWRLADALISAFIGLFLLPRTWQLLKSALDVLLEATPANLKVAEVESAMARVSGVESVHELHIWSITSGFVAMSGHVTARGRSSEDVLHDLQLMLRGRFGIEHATLQVEAADHTDDGACCYLDPRCLVVGQSPIEGR